MPEDERKKRQEFNRLMFVFQKQCFELLALVGSIIKTIAELLVLNFQFIKERNKKNET